MSFEGFYQLLCRNGHLRTADCYDFEDHERSCCCGEPFVFRHLVDDTNCDGEPLTFDVAEPAEVVRCNLGVEHVTREVRYQIPINARES